jgi:hypothetical protein
MSNISFPLTLKELTEMRRSGDRVSSFFAYLSIVSFAVSVFWTVIYGLSTLKTFIGITFGISIFSLILIYVYRPSFLIKKEKEFDELKSNVREWIIEIRKGLITYTTVTLSEIASKFSISEEVAKSVIKKLAQEKYCHINHQGNIQIGPSAGLKSKSPYD